MKHRIIVIVCSLFVALQASATHIVGGEFQMSEQRSGFYDIFLHLYFDEANGNPAAEDQSLIASIFAKSDDRLMRQLTMDKINKDGVEYENPDCIIPEVSTSKITYAAVRNDGEPGYGFQFTDEFNEPEGYYIVWDRCCRNDQIVNIETPGDVGMLFYLHFPRIFDDNGNLTNWSSPVFAPIPGTYACINEPFTMNFGATDIDGDSLVYSMRDPLIGFSSPNAPNPTLTGSEPYPKVAWRPGVGTANQIPGTPALNVNPLTGILSVTPSQAGLHVFSVLCEEYRNGVKIGGLRRDFQVFVYTNCQQNDPPSATLALEDSTFYTPGDTIRMQTDALTCLDLFVTDDADIRDNERISVRVVPVNFSSNQSLVSPGSDVFVGGIGDTLEGWKICTPTCEDIIGEPFKYDVIVSDDGCPIPKRDTIRVLVELIVAPNVAPIIEAYTDSNVTFLPNGDIRIDVYEIDTIDINFTSYDADSGNVISLEAIPDRFSLNDFGMEFQNMSGPGPVLSSDFRWIVNCEKLEGSSKDTFSIDFVTSDGSCDNKGNDTINVEINLNYEVVTKDFIGYNIFTPNGDGHNETFVIANLPRDNCENQYVSFEIYNRWGRKIYETDSRDIEWDGDDISDGVYFYVARYTEESYKGHFTILR